MPPFPVAVANDDIRQHRTLPAQSHRSPDTSKLGRLPIGSLQMEMAQADAHAGPLAVDGQISRLANQQWHLSEFGQDFGRR
jgi:hypothetical protein